VDYDEALDVIVGWVGSNHLVLCSFDMPGIGFEDRPFTGRLKEGLVPPEPGKPVVVGRTYINGELQTESDDGRHFSVWSTEPFTEAQARPLLQFFLARSTFSESGWEDTDSSRRGLMIRHERFRWVIFPQP
jgi:hypothetical protein